MCHSQSVSRRRLPAADSREIREASSRAGSGTPRVDWKPRDRTDRGRQHASNRRCRLSERMGPTATANRSGARVRRRSEEHTSELQSRLHLVCRLLLEKKKKNKKN